jgi:putative sterol carrier protein
MYDSIQGFFDGLGERLDPKRMAGMKATFQFIATGEDGGEYCVKIADGAFEVVTGKVENPTIVLTALASDWLSIMNGQMNGQTAFITGKLKIQGDMTLAMKLESLFHLG